MLKLKSLLTRSDQTTATGSTSTPIATSKDNSTGTLSGRKVEAQLALPPLDRSDLANTSTKQTLLDLFKSSKQGAITFGREASDQLRTFLSQSKGQGGSKAQSSALITPPPEHLLITDGRDTEADGESEAAVKDDGASPAIEDGDDKGEKADKARDAGDVASIPHADLPLMPVSSGGSSSDGDSDKSLKVSDHSDDEDAEASPAGKGAPTPATPSSDKLAPSFTASTKQWFSKQWQTFKAKKEAEAAAKKAVPASSTPAPQPQKITPPIADDSETGESSPADKDPVAATKPTAPAASASTPAEALVVRTTSADSSDDKAEGKDPSLLNRMAAKASQAYQATKQALGIGISGQPAATPDSPTKPESPTKGSSATTTTSTATTSSPAKATPPSPPKTANTDPSNPSSVNPAPPPQPASTQTPEPAPKQLQPAAVPVQPTIQTPVEPIAVTPPVVVPSAPPAVQPSNVLVPMQDVLTIKALNKDERKVLYKALKQLTKHKLPHTLNNEVVKKALAQLNAIKPEKNHGNLFKRLAKGFQNLFMGRISSKSLYKELRKLQKMVDKDFKKVQELERKKAALELEVDSLQDKTKKHRAQTKLNEVNQKYRVIKVEYLDKAGLTPPRKLS